MARKLNWRAASAGVTLLALAAPALAEQNFIPGGEETFKVTAGGVVSKFDSQVSLNGASGAGTEFDFSGDGRRQNDTNFFVSGTFRFLSRNRIQALYFQTKNSNSFTTQRDINIGDQTIPAGYTVDASQTDRFLFANYSYSFIKRPNLELAGVLGLYGGRFDFDVTGTPAGGTGTTIQRSASTTLPMPLIGGSFSWYPAPRWQVNAGLSGIHAKIGDIDGSVWVASAAAEFMVLRNVGLGLQWLHTNIGVDVDKSNWVGTLDVKSNNILFYGIVKF
jgi:hypothetical protein